MLGHSLQNCKKLSPMNIKEGIDKAKVHKKAQTVITQTGPTAAGRLGGMQPETIGLETAVASSAAAQNSVVILPKSCG